MPLTHDEFLRLERFGSLDGLRALSVLAVIWHHTAAHAFEGTPLRYAGSEGVTVFFAISGFLITWLLLGVLALVGAFAGAYLLLFYKELATRPGQPTTMDIVVACTGLVLLLEATRRAVGTPRRRGSSTSWTLARRTAGTSPTTAGRSPWTAARPTRS